MMVVEPSITLIFYKQSIFSNYQRNGVVNFGIIRNVLFSPYSKHLKDTLVVTLNRDYGDLGLDNLINVLQV